MKTKDFTIKQISKAAREAYKTVRTNIQYCGLDDVKTITVTSGMPGEGKSQVALNLAIAMAESDKKVLLINGDMRKPRNMIMSGIDCDIGLSNLLTGYEPIKMAIQSTYIKNFQYIPSGETPVNPAELVGTERFRALLLNLLNNFKYDKIIIDTPPLKSVIDGAVIATQTDGTILVVKYKSTDVATVQEAKEQLEKLKVKILGVVLNRMHKNEYKHCNAYEKYYRKYNKNK
jgi:capsular exopolysaccharide synthesis family protein